MSRIAKPGAVPPKMYRHFAVITIAITGCVALFADGDKREMVKDEFAKREMRNEMLEAEAQKMGARRLAVNGMAVKARPAESFAPEESSSIGTEGGIAPDNASEVTIRNNRGGNEPRLLGPMGSDLRGGTEIPKVLPRGMAAEDYIPIGAPGSANPRRVGAPRKLTPDQLQRISEISRERTGKTEAGSE